MKENVVQVKSYVLAVQKQNDVDELLRIIGAIQKTLRANNS